MKKIYIIWIWWIWISGIARYYNENWYKVYWSDKTDSELIKKLKSEWIDIIIWEDSERIDNTFDKIIYTEAVPKTQSELEKSIKLNLNVLTYPESLALIANQKQLIAVAWTHWKSTTTSIISIMLKDSKLWTNSLVWSLLKEFNWKNVYFSNSNNFVLEACEYKRSFLRYKPYIWVITNIDLDHLDYYKDLEDYISAFKSFQDNIISNWYLVIDKNDKNSMKLFNTRNDINYILLWEKDFELNGKKYFLPNLNLKIPGSHILYDAYLAYIVWIILWLDSNEIVYWIEKYNWIWRRSEVVWETLNGNILLSDYWHHPTEISLNLKALKQKYIDKKIVTVFQPHQYNRTLELLEDFKNCFWDTDILIIPDIYESRDTQEDKDKINWEKLINYISHNNKIFWNWLNNTLNLIKDLDKKHNSELVIILQWAWNIDDLRYDIELK